jgi:hypothetical protein
MLQGTKMTMKRMVITCTCAAVARRVSSAHLKSMEFEACFKLWFLRSFDFSDIFSALDRAIITSWPHPLQRRRKSAPTRVPAIPCCRRDVPFHFQKRRQMDVHKVAPFCRLVLRQVFTFLRI